jgi:hypothetical protein
MDKSSIRVRHLGNTANNAFYNSQLLADHAGIDSEFPIAMFGLLHGISAPAWEVVDFAVPSAEWVAQPDWSVFPEAVAVNADYTDLPRPDLTAQGVDLLPSEYRSPNLLTGLRRSANAMLNGKRWAQPLFDFRMRQLLAKRTDLLESENAINIIYGADSLASVKAPQPSRHTVCLEHGTIRWIADGSAEHKLLRQVYREQVRASSHLWVTNLDPRTLEIAEDVAPGRWSVLPHPYIPNPRAPYPESAATRRELLRLTSSQSLVLLPASQNWAKHHDKGSMKALNAFVELRTAGRDIGLVAVEWGLDLAESKAFLERTGVGAHVAWVAPMARLGLQRMMANVDVVWDQFGLDAFGGLALRAMDQGTPLVSRGLAPVGEQLIGGPVPWRHAATVEEIVRETGMVLDDTAALGREKVIQDSRTRYRSWLLKRHSPAITAQLQREVYEGILDGSWEPGTATRGRWGALLDEKMRKSE